MKLEKYSLIDLESTKLFESLHLKKEKDWYNNQFHLSGYSGSINDPNGLIYFDNKYHIFLQNCPFSIEHWNKSWGLYTTTDFINYKYEGITLTPSNNYDIHGVFSGSARVNSKGEMEIYYTGNLKFEDSSRTSYTMKALIDLNKKVVNKEFLFKCDSKKYTGHFRDPFVFERNNSLYMINGAQDKNKKGVLSIYKFANNEWVWKKDLNFTDEIDKEAYMVECPNYFILEKKQFLIACIEKEDNYKEFSHPVKYREVEFNEKKCDFKFKSQTNLLDFGFDFYAPQIFSNTKDRTILLGWLGNSALKPLPPELTTWSNHLTIPRELFLRNNELYQWPIEELIKLRKERINNFLGCFSYENGLVEIVSNDIKTIEWELKICSQKREILIKNSEKGIEIDRSNMDFNDKTNLPPIIKNSGFKINSFRLLVDRSCLEFYINEGQKVFSVRFFIKNHNLITTNLDSIDIYQLDSYKYDWNNTIFKNLTK